MLRHGIIKSFNAGTYAATVQLSGSIGQWVSLPVSRGIAAGEMVAGRQVAVALFDAANAADGVVVAVYV